MWSTPGVQAAEDPRWSSGRAGTHTQYEWKILSSWESLLEAVKQILHIEMHSIPLIFYALIMSNREIYVAFVSLVCVPILT